MRNTLFWWILIGVMILLDIYFFLAIKVVSQSAGTRTKTIIYACYWAISAGAIITLLVLPYLQFEHQSKLFRTTIFALIAGLFFAKLVASVFFLIDDTRRGIQWTARKLISSENQPASSRDGDK